MSESDGLIFCVHVGPDGLAQDWTWADTARHDAEGGFLWLHLDAEADETVRWMREESGLDPATQDALLAAETRPRVHRADDTLLLMLRGVNLNPGEQPDDMIALRILAQEGRLVTLRRRPLRTVEAVHTALVEGRIEATAGSLLVAICDQLTRYVGEVVESIEDRVDQLEEQVLSAESRELRARISDLRRQMIALRRYLAPQREALSRLGTERPSWLAVREQGRLREVTDRSVRHVEELDEAREHAAVAYEELGGRLTERVEQRMYVLSIVAAIFLPLGFVTGLLGINVGGMPGADDPAAFGYVLGGCLVVGVFTVFLLKRRGWF